MSAASAIGSRVLHLASYLALLAEEKVRRKISAHD